MQKKREVSNKTPGLDEFQIIKSEQEDTSKTVAEDFAAQVADVYASNSFYNYCFFTWKEIIKSH